MVYQVLQKLAYSLRMPVELLIGLFLTIALLSGCGLSIIWDCDQRETNIPEPPMYPNAHIVNKVLFADHRGWAGARIEYETGDTPSQVAEFYSQPYPCNIDRDTNYASCQGYAAPFGDYFLTIDLSPKPITTFYADVYWDRCSNDIN